MQRANPYQMQWGLQDKQLTGRRGRLFQREIGRDYRATRRHNNATKGSDSRSEPTDGGDSDAPCGDAIAGHYVHVRQACGTRRCPRHREFILSAIDRDAVDLLSYLAERSGLAGDPLEQTSFASDAVFAGYYRHGFELLGDDIVTVG